MTKRVIGYIRVSTSEQATEGVSLAAQEAKLRSYCQTFDLELVRVEVDAGLSASTLDRPALQRALASLKAKDAAGLIVTKLDRLTRSQRDLCTLLEGQFKAGRSELISMGESLDTSSAAGRMMVGFLVLVSQWEREAIGERTSAAMQHMRAQGKCTGRVPYGKRLAEDGETLLPCEAEQLVMAEARALRESGLTLRAVAAELAKKGFHARNGGPFGPEQVKRLVSTCN